MTNWHNFFFLLIFLVFLIYMFSFRRRNYKLMPGILLWTLIFLVLISLYAFRFELKSFKDRIISVIIPSYNWVNEQGELVISRHRDGHFYLNAYGEGKVLIKFLIDTGASDIALTHSDAVKLGFDPKNLRYTKKYNTANGITYAAPIKINQLTIGNKTYYNLKANVTSGKLDISLLGMSVIDDFQNFTITRDMLILSH